MGVVGGGVFYMAIRALALFGQAEKGLRDTVYFCRSLRELFDQLGEAPQNTRGIYFAIQALLYGTSVIYFCVKEEGVSADDYISGFRYLRHISPSIITLQALFLPGVGSSLLIDEGISICHEHHSLLIVQEADFYDYMTS